MRYSADAEILKAHKYKNIARNSAFSGSGKIRMLLLLLTNVKMPIVGILTFMSRKNFHAQLS